MRADDLTGIELDYWVAKAEDIDVRKLDWNFIGKIIERDRIVILPPWEAHDEVECIVYFPFWNCKIQKTEWKDEWIESDSSESALEAIKRCIVKTKYGEEINEIAVHQ